MDTAKELQVLREELIREIDEKIGQMLKKLQNEKNMGPICFPCF